VGSLLAGPEGRAATAGEVEAMARVGDAQLLLLLLAYLFRTGRFRGGASLAAVLAAAEVPCEQFCWFS
jgi:hypothetical protein